MFELKANYREAMTYQVYGFIGLILLPFSAWAAWSGNLMLAIPPAATALLSLLNGIYYKRRKAFFVPPVLVSLLYVGNNVLAIWQLGAPALLWAYPTMLAFYTVHTRFTAHCIVPLLYVCVCVSTYAFLPFEFLPRVAATLFAMAVLFHVAAGWVEQQFQEVKRLTITDHLTGAFNRRFMDSKISELIEDQKRNHSNAAMISLDVDHFKAINDHFGHSLGDKVLVGIVDLLHARVRVLDKVCRAGGEEFVILLPDTTQQQAYTLADDIRRAISESDLLNQSTLTISCGIAALMPGDNRDTWLKRCDQALYQAKQNGRNKVVIGQLNGREAFA